MRQFSMFSILLFCSFHLFAGDFARYDIVEFGEYLGGKLDPAKAPKVGQDYYVGLVKFGDVENPELYLNAPEGALAELIVVGEDAAIRHQIRLENNQRYLLDLGAVVEDADRVFVYSLQNFSAGLAGSRRQNDGALEDLFEVTPAEMKTKRAAICAGTWTLTCITPGTCGTVVTSAPGYVSDNTFLRCVYWDCHTPTRFGVNSCKTASSCGCNGTATWYWNSSSDSCPSVVISKCPGDPDSTYLITTN